MFTAALHHQEAGGRQQTPWHHQYGYPQHELWSDNFPLPCPVFVIQVIPRQSVVVVVSQAVFLSI